MAGQTVTYREINTSCCRDKHYSGTTDCNKDGRLISLSPRMPGGGALTAPHVLVLMDFPLKHVGLFLQHYWTHGRHSCLSWSSLFSFDLSLLIFTIEIAWLLELATTQLALRLLWSVLMVLAPVVHCC